MSFGPTHELDFQAIRDRNKRIITSYLKAFIEGDPARMTKLLSEDAVFEIHGPEFSICTRKIQGKKNIHAFYKRRQAAGKKFIKTLTIDGLFERLKIHTDKNIAIAEWTCNGTENSTNMQFRASGTNHFVLDDGKIKHVRIYVNAPLDSSVKSIDEDRLLVSDQEKLALMAWSVV